MTYAYNTHGAPAVGGGLPGLPQRQSSGGITSGAIPVNAQFGYADEQPANAVEVGAIVEREDYPALSAQIPHTFEQTVQIPMVAPYSPTYQVIAEFSEDARYLAIGSAVSANNLLVVYGREKDSFILSGSSAGNPPSQSITCMRFSRTSEYLYVGANQTSNALHVVKLNPNVQYSFTYLTSLGGSSWPVKLLAVSPDGTLLAAASSTTSSGVQRVKLWRRSGDTFTAVTLSVTTSATVYGIDFSSDGKYLFVTHSLTGYVRIFDVSGSVPVEVSHGLGITDEYVMRSLPEGGAFLLWRAGASPSFKAMTIRESGGVWVKTPVVNASGIPAVVSASVIGNSIQPVDDGNRVIAITGSADSEYDFSRLPDGSYRYEGELRVPDRPFNYMAYSNSASADSKFYAAGLYAPPWLRVYGSETKMVARLNERSPTSQKLYMKAG